MKKFILGLMVFCAVMLNVNTVKGEDAMITEGKTVKFDYVLTVDGQVIDSSEGKTPLEYVHGQNMIIPGLESKMEGLKAGDHKIFVIAAEQGYGSRNDNLVVQVPKANLGNDIDPQVGMMLQMQNPNGQAMSAIIIDVKDDIVTLDFNHPLAGKELSFDVTVVSVE